jgi:hypothetical protein
VGREQVLELGQRGDSGFLETGDSAVDRRSQTDGDSDGFVIVEQERRQAAPSSQAIAAMTTGLGLDRVPQLSQAIDITADRSLGDFQPFGQLGAAPRGAGLQEAKELEHASRGVAHTVQILPLLGLVLSA